MTRKQQNNQPVRPVTRRTPVKAAEPKPEVREPVRAENIKTSKPKIILKNGATDCRRSEKALSKIIDEKMHLNPRSGDMYGFANSTRTIAKLIRFDETGVNLYKKHTHTSFPWPPYDKGVSALEGSQVKRFLDAIGLPEEIFPQSGDEVLT